MSCAIDLLKRPGFRCLTDCERRRAIIIDFEAQRSLILRHELELGLAREIKTLEHQVLEMESMVCHPDALDWLRNVLVILRAEFVQARTQAVS